MEEEEEDPWMEPLQWDDLIFEDTEASQLGSVEDFEREVETEYSSSSSQKKPKKEFMWKERAPKIFDSLVYELFSSAITGR